MHSIQMVQAVKTNPHVQAKHYQFPFQRLFSGSMLVFGGVVIQIQTSQRFFV